MAREFLGDLPEEGIRWLCHEEELAPASTPEKLNAMVVYNNTQVHQGPAKLAEMDASTRTALVPEIDADTFALGRCNMETPFTQIMGVGKVREQRFWLLDSGGFPEVVISSKVETNDHLAILRMNFSDYTSQWRTEVRGICVNENTGSVIGMMAVQKRLFCNSCAEYSAPCSCRAQGTQDEMRRDQLAHFAGRRWTGARPGQSLWKQFTSYVGEVPKGHIDKQFTVLRCDDRAAPGSRITKVMHMRCFKEVGLAGPQVTRSVANTYISKYFGGSLGLKSFLMPADYSLASRAAQEEHDLQRYLDFDEEDVLEMAAPYNATAMVPKDCSIEELWTEGSKDGSIDEGWTAAPEPEVPEKTKGTKAKDTTCDICGGLFRRKYDRDRHKRSVHLHERQHRCQICGKGFFQRAHMRAHMEELHAGARTVPCPVCNVMFFNKHKAERHMRAVHLRERPYQCTMCSSRYFQKSDLTRHMKKSHSDRSLQWVEPQAQMTAT